MIDILDELQSYVPTVSTSHEADVPGFQSTFTVNADKFHYTLLGKHHSLQIIMHSLLN